MFTPAENMQFRLGGHNPALVFASGTGSFSL